MKKKYGLKPILASLLVTAALATPMVVLSSNAVPTWDAELIFEGARLEYKEVNGETTIQAIFDVAVDKVVNGTGAAFYLDYNPDYLTPSNFETNAIAASGENDEFFSPDPELYGKKDANGKLISPFSENVTLSNGTESYYSYLDAEGKNHQIMLNLKLDQAPGGVLATEGEGGKIERLEGAVYDENNPWEPPMDRYTINAWLPVTWDEAEDGEEPEPLPDIDQRKVVLGQISFQVNKERLPEIVKYFGDVDAVLSYTDTANPAKTHRKTTQLLDNKNWETYLLDIDRKKSDPWMVTALVGDNDGNVYLGRMSDGQYSPQHGSVGRANVAEHYIYKFPKDIIIDVEATNPELVINAYQNYHKSGDPGVDDLPISLGIYSPMVTVTYADGSKENIPFPWGRTADDYEITSGLPDNDPAKYQRTGGDYWFAQYYVYEVDGTDGDGNPVKIPVRFPKKVTAHMTVTPIKVIDVTADDLERTYLLNLVTSQVKDVDDLALPTQARIITDIVPAGVSLVTPIEGWMPVRGDSAWPDPDDALHSLKADQDNASGGTPYWPEVTDVNLQADDHVGDYSFKTSTNQHNVEWGIQSAAIRAAFPWLTVPDQSDNTPSGRDEWLLENAKRHIISVEDKDFADPANYAVSYVRTVTQGTTTKGNGDGQPTLTLAVRRTDKDIAASSVFRIWLPNGQEIGTGQNKGGVQVDDWFGGETFDDHSHGFYDPGQREVDDNNHYRFELDINPDDPDPNPADNDPDHDLDRETLRRYINLGGWYKVAICEDPDKNDPNAPDNWTDPIPVYVQPRRNEYTEDKTYNFIAENAALFNWPGGVKDTIYLPQGSYTPVGPMYGTTGVGLPLYNKEGTVIDGLDLNDEAFENNNPLRPRLSRYEESYGVKTIYDGQTGAQPGEIFTIKVNKDDTTHTANWTNPTQTEQLHSLVDAALQNTPPTHTKVYKYGPTPLYDGVQIMAYGFVWQPEADTTRYRATLRTQLEEKAPQIEKIKLVSAEPTGITREVQDDLDSNVLLATYDTQMEGYTVRQPYVFTIKNVGDVDIYGLNIDGLTDRYVDEPDGGHFVLLQPPATFLPAGASTTFTMTYVYDLKGNEDKALVYRDTLYITSTSHSDVNHPGTHDMDDYLLEFDAQFTVSKDPLHKVTVIYKPTNGTMGTAGLIVGEQGSGASKVMNYTATAQTFPAKDKVYVVVNPLDEYGIKSVTLDDGAGHTVFYEGNPVTIAEYVANGGDSSLVRDGTVIYVFEMPDQDVTVTVNFYEPLRSKLRLSNLIEFSAPHGDDNDLKTSANSDRPDDPHVFPVWRKVFTGQEEWAANDWATTANANSGLHLMTHGAARPHAPGYPAGGWPSNAVPASEGQQFLPSWDQYIVVIDEDFDLSQVEATLRQVQYHEDYRGPGYNKDIEVSVLMEVYPYEVLEHWDDADRDAAGYGPTVVYSKDVGYGPNPGLTFDPNIPGPTTHTTAQFAENSMVCPPGGISATQAISPKPGESTYVRITLSGQDVDENGNKIGETEYRYYYLEIHRKTKDPQVDLNYGNSPYGMIWNNSNWTDNASRTYAENGFRNAGYKFPPIEDQPSVTPPKAAQHGLCRVTYWREAWVRNRGLFEPESFTAANDIANPPWVDTSVYDPAENLDLNEYAYFAILGEDMREPGVARARDSSGREVDINTISAEAEVTLLDVTQTKQVARFSGQDTATIHLGVANGNRILGFAGENQAAVTLPLTGENWPVSASTTTTAPTEDGEEPATTTTYSLIENIRPGRYVIQYTYTDFDGVSKLNYYRPFVILRGVGDVNTDGDRTNGRLTVGSDEYAIEDRVTDPLGYEAGEWDVPTTSEDVYPHANIFKFRVCDVNNDRNINNIDANLVDKNVRNDGGWLRFYEPVDYGLPDITP